MKSFEKSRFNYIIPFQLVVRKKPSVSWCCLRLCLYRSFSGSPLYHARHVQWIQLQNRCKLPDIELLTVRMVIFQVPLMPWSLWKIQLSLTQYLICIRLIIVEHLVCLFLLETGPSTVVISSTLVENSGLAVSMNGFEWVDRQWFFMLFVDNWFLLDRYQVEHHISFDSDTVNER